jgi:hypothetical protein
MSPWLAVRAGSTAAVTTAAATRTSIAASSASVTPALRSQGRASTTKVISVHGYTVSHSTSAGPGVAR